MAEITIRLVYNLKTGRKDIYVDYESQADALPIEHEQAHRQIVERLIGQGLVQASEVGDVVISRGAQAADRVGEAAPSAARHQHPQEQSQQE